MVFSSLTFLLIFLPIVLLLYFIWNDLRWRNGVLVVASLIFYGWGEPIWILAMLFSAFVNYAGAYALDKTRKEPLRKLYLVLSLAGSLGILFYFKYAAFFINTFSTLFSIPLKLPVLGLPIGISFYTFQVITYTIDVYNKKARRQSSFAHVLLYVSHFPQLIAGPIVQYADIAQMINSRRSTMEGFVAGGRRFVIGLAKKVLVANICGEALDKISSANGGSAVSLAGSWVSAILFGLQIYYDFSAYSDMAIGLGKIFGFTYKENFNYPYVSASVTEFWRRWHISLGSFFRDYVYIPLGGNRKGDLRTALNMLIVWALTGLWHGASWNFIVWGLYYCFLLLLEKFVFANVLKRIPKAVRVVLTLIFVLFGWVIFYYTDISQVAAHIMAMLGLSVTEAGIGAIALIDSATVDVLCKYSVFPLIAMIGSAPVIPYISRTILKKEQNGLAYTIAASIMLTALLGLSLLFLIGQSYNPFIYFRF